MSRGRAEHRDESPPPRKPTSKGGRPFSNLSGQRNPQRRAFPCLAAALFRLLPHPTPPRRRRRDTPRIPISGFRFFRGDQEEKKKKGKREERLEETRDPLRGRVRRGGVFDLIVAAPRALRDFRDR